MSASQPQPPSSPGRWRAPAIGAMTGLAVAAAIVVPSAIAASGQTAGRSVAGKIAQVSVSSHAGASKGAAAAGTGAAAPAGSVPPQFLAAIAQLQQAGTISAAQARTLDADIESGSIDPKALVSDGVVTVAQMAAVNDRLVAVKTGLATQAHAGSSASQSNAGG